MPVKRINESKSYCVDICMYVCLAIITPSYLRSYRIRVLCDM